MVTMYSFSRSPQPRFSDRTSGSDTPCGAPRKSETRSRAVARGVALFLGGFSFLNFLGGVITDGFDANIWWIDLHTIAPVPTPLLLVPAALALIAYGARPAMSRWRKRITVTLVWIATAITLWNSITFYSLLADGTLPTAFPIPLSLVMTLVLAFVIAQINRVENRVAPTHWLALWATIVAFLVGFPLMQMFCFGMTDYRRPVDVIVVPGARAYADGTPSLPLADRVRTACDLFRQGFSPRLIFSGGPGDGAIHETESMRQMALGLGVPDSAILLDPDGLSTGETVIHTLPIIESIGAKRVMVVSHFYHLPRIKMSYQRQGINVFTVPAKESRMMTGMPIYLAREVVGLWGYYLVALRIHNSSQ